MVQYPPARDLRRLGSTWRDWDLARDVALIPDAIRDQGPEAVAEEIRTLARTISRYGNNPQRIEMDFVQVHAGLPRQIATQDLPPSEENTALRDALEEGARAIRATHPDVAENRAILQRATFQEISDDEAIFLDTAAPVLETISDDATAEE